MQIRGLILHNKLPGFHLSWLKPFNSHTLQVGLSKGDLCSVGPKSFWPILEIELALDEEDAKLVGSGKIKDIRLVNLGM